MQIPGVLLLLSPVVLGPTNSSCSTDILNLFLSPQLSKSAVVCLWIPV